jgi:uncharacterized protein (DUF1684 family)
MSELKAFRVEKDDFFKHHPESPLTPDQRRGFAGLEYFPEDEALRLEVEVERFFDQQPIQMQTSTSGVQTYVRYGKFKFEAEGQPAELTIYQNENGYFLPFVDSLAGKETYPAGRYLEPEQLYGNRFLVDFNIAYNPLCAYNEMWSCPITPPENRLNIPIRAGEKLFDHE